MNIKLGLEVARIVYRNLRAELLLHDTFSQHHEDVTISKYLPEKFGHYLDIGCGNPVLESNTFSLYKRGWRGQMVDAWNVNCIAGKIIRRKDTFQNVVMNLHGSPLTFYIFDPYQYSTADPLIYDDLVSRGIRFCKSIELPGMRLSDLTPEITPSQPGLLSIDIEGLDFEVLESNNWDVYLPRVICIENISGAESIQLERDLASRNSKSHELLTSNGYELVELCGPSRIYVHQKYLFT